MCLSFCQFVDGKSNIASYEKLRTFHENACPKVNISNYVEITPECSFLLPVKAQMHIQTSFYELDVSKLFHPITEFVSFNSQQ